LVRGAAFPHLEFALLRDLGLVGEKTPIVTTVHPLQIVEESIPMEAHDIPVDLIATPDAVLSIAPRRPRPRGIQWDLLTDDQIAAIPALAALRGAD
jgi:5-formyltetrahydrofolate cyclo-ligase